MATDTIEDAKTQYEAVQAQQLKAKEQARQPFDESLGAEIESLAKDTAEQNKSQLGSTQHFQNMVTSRFQAAFNVSALAGPASDDLASIIPDFDAELARNVRGYETSNLSRSLSLRDFVDAEFRRKQEPQGIPDELAATIAEDWAAQNVDKSSAQATAKLYYLATELGIENFKGGINEVENLQKSYFANKFYEVVRNDKAFAIDYLGSPEFSALPTNQKMSVIDLFNVNDRRIEQLKDIVRDAQENNIMSLNWASTDYAHQLALLEEEGKLDYDNRFDMLPAILSQEIVGQFAESSFANKIKIGLSSFGKMTVDTIAEHPWIFGASIGAGAALGRGKGAMMGFGIAQSITSADYDADIVRVMLTAELKNLRPDMSVEEIQDRINGGIAAYEALNAGAGVVLSVTDPRSLMGFLAGAAKGAVKGVANIAGGEFVVGVGKNIISQGVYSEVRRLVINPVKEKILNSMIMRSSKALVNTATSIKNAAAKKYAGEAVAKEATESVAEAGTKEANEAGAKEIMKEASKQTGETVESLQTKIDLIESTFSGHPYRNVLKQTAINMGIDVGTATILTQAAQTADLVNRAEAYKDMIGKDYDKFDTILNGAFKNLGSNIVLNTVFTVPFHGVAIIGSSRQINRSMKVARSLKELQQKLIDEQKLADAKATLSGNNPLDGGATTAEAKPATAQGEGQQKTITTVPNKETGVVDQGEISQALADETVLIQAIERGVESQKNKTDSTAQPERWYIDVESLIRAMDMGSVSPPAALIKLLRSKMTPGNPRVAISVSELAIALKANFPELSQFISASPDDSVLHTIMENTDTFAQHVTDADNEGLFDNRQALYEKREKKPGVSSASVFGEIGSGGKSDKPKANSATESETKGVTDNKPKTGAASVFGEAHPTTEPKPETTVEAKPAPKEEPQAEIKTKSKSKSKSKSKAKAKGKAEPEKTETEKVEEQPEFVSETEPQPEVQVEAEPQADTEATGDVVPAPATQETAKKPPLNSPEDIKAKQDMLSQQEEELRQRALKEIEDQARLTTALGFVRSKIALGLAKNTKISAYQIDNIAKDLTARLYTLAQDLNVPVDELVKEHCPDFVVETEYTFDVASGQILGADGEPVSGRMGRYYQAEPGKKAKIVIYPGGDAMTLYHETIHFSVDILMSLADRPSASLELSYARDKILEASSDLIFARNQEIAEENKTLPPEQQKAPISSWADIQKDPKLYSQIQEKLADDTIRALLSGTAGDGKNCLPSIERLLMSAQANRDKAFAERSNIPEQETKEQKRGRLTRNFDEDSGIDTGSYHHKTTFLDALTNIGVGAIATLNSFVHFTTGLDFLGGVGRATLSLFIPADKLAQIINREEHLDTHTLDTLCDDRYLFASAMGSDGEYNAAMLKVREEFHDPKERDRHIEKLVYYRAQRNKETTELHDQIKAYRNGENIRDGIVKDREQVKVVYDRLAAPKEGETKIPPLSYRDASLLKIGPEALHALEKKGLIATKEEGAIHLKEYEEQFGRKVDADLLTKLAEFEPNDDVFVDRTVTEHMVSKYKEEHFQGADPLTKVDKMRVNDLSSIVEQTVEGMAQVLYRKNVQSGDDLIKSKINNKKNTRRKRVKGHIAKQEKKLGRALKQIELEAIYKADGLNPDGSFTPATLDEFRLKAENETLKEEAGVEAVKAINVATKERMQIVDDEIAAKTKEKGSPLTEKEVEDIYRFHKLTQNEDPAKRELYVKEQNKILSGMPALNTEKRFQTKNTLAEEIQTTAAQTIGKIRLSDIHPSTFIRAAVETFHRALKLWSTDKKTAFALARQAWMHVFQARIADKRIASVRRKINAINKVLRKGSSSLSKNYDVQYLRMAQLYWACLTGSSLRKAIFNIEEIKRYAGSEYKLIQDWYKSFSEKGMLLRDLPLDQVEALTDVLLKQIFVAREIKKSVDSARAAIDMDRVNMVSATLKDYASESGLNVKEVQESAGGSQTSTWQKTKDFFMKYKLAFSKLEGLVTIIDGKHNGPLHSIIFMPLQKANNHYYAMQRTFSAKLKPILSKMKTATEDAVRVRGDGTWEVTITRTKPDGTTEEVPFLYKRKNAFGAEETYRLSFGATGKFKGNAALDFAGWLVHFGNISNLERLCKTYNITSDEAFAILRSAIKEGLVTKEILEQVQGVWDIYHELLPMSQETYRNMNGYYFRTIENNRMVVDLNGEKVVMRGGYVPARMKDDVDVPKMSENDYMAAMMEMFPTSNPGFAKDRSENLQFSEVDTDFSNALLGLDQQIRFITLTPACLDVWRLAGGIGHPEIKAMLDAAHKDLSWLIQETAKDVMFQRSQRVSPSFRLINSVASRIMSTSNAAMLAWNIGNIITGLSNIFLARTRVSYADMATGFADMVGGHGYKTIALKSEYMRARWFGHDETLKAAKSQFLKSMKNPALKVVDFLNDNLYFGQKWVARFTDVITWNAAYNKAFNSLIKEVNNDLNLSPEARALKEARVEEQAIQQADETVRETQGSFDILDSSIAEKSNALVKFFSPFVSFFVNVSNMIAVESRLQTKQKSRLMQYALRASLLFNSIILPTWFASICMGAANGGFSDYSDDDTPGSIALKIAGPELLKGFISTRLPVFSSVGNWAINKFEGTAYSGAALGSHPAISKLEKSLGAMAKGVNSLYDEDTNFTSTDFFALFSVLDYYAPGVAPFRDRLNVLVNAANDNYDTNNAFEVSRALITGRESPQQRKDRANNQ